MASKSRPRKSSTPNLDLLNELLSDGKSFSEPSSAQLAAAKYLSSRGLVRVENDVYVKCANPIDGDFPPGNRNCAGRIALDPDLDEAGGEIKCPDCNRIVYPIRRRKQQFQELRGWHDSGGILRFVEGLLAAAELHVAPTDSPAAFMVSSDELARQVLVGVLDYADDSDYFDREYAQHNPAFYVVVDIKNLEHQILEEDWIARASLAELLIAGDLSARVEEISKSLQPSSIANLRTRIVSKRPHTKPPSAPAESDHLIYVELDSKGLWVQGQQVVSGKGLSQLPIIKILRDSFLEDLRDDRAAENFQALSLLDISESMSAQTGKPANPDDEAIRRPILRCRDQISKVLREELGVPIGDDDVIENYGGGYRFNPRRVVFRPIQANPKRS